MSSTIILIVLYVIFGLALIGGVGFVVYDTLIHKTSTRPPTSSSKYYCHNSTFPSECRLSNSEMEGTAIIYDSLQNCQKSCKHLENICDHQNPVPETIACDAPNVIKSGQFRYGRYNATLCPTGFNPSTTPLKDPAIIQFPTEILNHTQYSIPTSGLGFGILHTPQCVILDPYPNVTKHYDINWTCGPPLPK
jgi:hypothetical protein